MTTTEGMTDGEKRLKLLKGSILEHAREKLGEIAGEIYSKGYDFSNFPALFRIGFQERRVSAVINYPTGEIAFYTGERFRMEQSEDHVDELRNFLFYKPILDAVAVKVSALPDYFDADGDLLDELAEKTTLPKEVIEDRTIVDKIELSPDDIETIANILEQNDFPGILEEYSTRVMSAYFEEAAGAAPSV